MGKIRPLDIVVDEVEREHKNRNKTVTEAWTESKDIKKDEPRRKTKNSEHVSKEAHIFQSRNDVY